jgi:PilZ domain
MTPPRAARFSLRLPIRYRTVGEAGWKDGVTENISRSGVLFRAADLLRVDTPIEMRLVLPVAGRTEQLPEILCQGHIVRTVFDVGKDQQQPALAATITRYRIRGDNPTGS